MVEAAEISALTLALTFTVSFTVCILSFIQPFPWPFFGLFSGLHNLVASPLNQTFFPGVFTLVLCLVF
ncbi:MAG: hypothetical protein CMQ69_03110 [Gammaproteobacteria bacterium]|nr:hypothetical protein [Gammaproteobacteria bacterium]